MNTLLAETLALSEAALLAGFVVFLRVGSAMALLPVFGERSIPMRVRLGLTLSFTLIVTPVVMPLLGPQLESFSAYYFLTETIAGLSIGAVIRFLVLALQIAGSIAAQSTSLSQLFGGAVSDPQPAIGHVLLVAGLALAVYTGLHIRLVELFVFSYEVFLPGQLLPAGLWAEWGISRAASAFSLAFALAAPFVIASLIYNVAMGVINRAMPQLMVAFVGAPAITAGGLILLMLTAPYLLNVWVGALNTFLSTPFGGF